MANRKLLLLNGKLDWNDDSVLLIKPNVSCGASDAWQFCYSRNHKFTGERDWQELAKICSLNVEVDQSYLIMPWSDGRPVSVSFLATPTGLFQFPPCEQLISLSPKLSVEQFAAAKVSYKGSKWADTCSREVIANQLPEILSQLIPPDFRNQLRGWFGIDLMIKDSQVDIIDFNGRWTSSYNLIRQLMVQS